MIATAGGVTSEVSHASRSVDHSSQLRAGALLSPRTRPHCERPPDDFANEETVVKDRPREAVLKRARQNATESSILSLDAVSS